MGFKKKEIHLPRWNLPFSITLTIFVFMLVTQNLNGASKTISPKNLFVFIQTPRNVKPPSFQHNSVLKMSFDTCGTLLKIQDTMINKRLYPVIKDAASCSDATKSIRLLTQEEIDLLYVVPDLPGGIRRLLTFFESSQCHIIDQAIIFTEEEYGELSQSKRSALKKSMIAIYHAFALGILISDFGERDLKTEFLNEHAILLAKSKFHADGMDRSLIIFCLKTLDRIMNSYFMANGGVGGCWSESKASKVFRSFLDGIENRLY